MSADPITDIQRIQTVDEKIDELLTVLQNSPFCEDPSIVEAAGHLLCARDELSKFISDPM